MSKVKNDPTLFHALIPVLFLIFLLSSSVYLFHDNSSYGPNQIALILSACLGTLVGMRNGYTWKELETAMVEGISLAMGALFILLVVGSLIGTWILSGVVPTMIYYGLLILHPSIFYVASCVVCALVAIATGSSWTTSSTIGIALVGIAGAMDLNLGLTAGAIISGAYFGDKLSPLSDTTNLAPAVAGTDLFTHIRHMLWTTLPSITIACIIFAIFGFSGGKEMDSANLQTILSSLEASFNIGWYLLIPPVCVLGMVMKKIPAFPALLIGALIGAVFAAIFQQEAIAKLVADPQLSPFTATVKGCWTALFSGYSSNTGNEALDALLTRGGMASMINTIWLIISAMMFGAVMEKTKMLEVIAAHVLTFSKNTGSLIFATLTTSIGMNIIASDQYIAIVLPGRMFRAEFQKYRLKPKNLSRCLEDSGTLTSPLIPWNTCGAFMAQSLGVPTFTYLPYCFFNLMNPVISAIYGFTGFSIEKFDANDAPGVSQIEAA